MSSPKSVIEISNSNFQVPKDVKIGDFVVARFKSSVWADHLPWEDWHHVGMISQLEPLKVIEVSGISLQKKDKNTAKMVYKSYSRSITGMYLETYGRPRDIKAGYVVTPEDLFDSPRSKVYFSWKKSNKL